MPRPALALLLLAAAALPARAQPGPQAAAFVLARGPQGPELQAVPLAEGQAVVLPRGGDTLGVVLPPLSPGMSGELLPGGATGAWVLRLAAGRLSVALADGGEPRPIAEAPLDALGGWDVFVSLVGADGGAWAFTLRGWRDPRREQVAPPLDLFSGRVPLRPGDHVLTTAVTPRDAGAPLAGRSPLRRVGRHLVLEVQAPDGRPALLVVDTAAATTVVTPRLLPPGVQPQAGGMVERSAAGTRVLDPLLSGATGAAGGLLGEVLLAELPAKGLVLRDVHASVLESLPTLGDEPVDGILGMDVLRRAGAVRLRAPAGDVPGELELLDAAPPAPEGCLRVPMTLVNGLAWLRADAGGTPLHLLLDSGAATSVLSPAAAARLGATDAGGADAALRGLSDAATAARRAELPALRLDALDLSPCPVLVADVAPLARVAGGAAAGVLGLPEIERGGTLLLDLGAGVARFER